MKRGRARGKRGGKRKAMLSRKVAEIIAEAQHECVDCGVPTTPCKTELADNGCPSYTFTPGTWEMYLVKDRIWSEAGMEVYRKGKKLGPRGRGTNSGSLCVGCIEKRLGRELRSEDFKFGDNGYNIPDYSTPRLRARMGLDPLANFDLEGVA